MSINSWLFLGFALCVVGDAGAQVDDFAYTKRVINGYVVDISPLTKWMDAYSNTNKNESLQVRRPMEAWRLIVGSATNPIATGSWIVEGRVDGVSATLILINPPISEYQEFLVLKAKYAALKRANETSTNLPMPAGIDMFPVVESADLNNPVRMGMIRERRDSSISAFNRGIRDYQQKQRMKMGNEQELDKLKAKGYDLNGEFVIRCLALRTGLVTNGLAVYDRGVILR